MSPLRSASLSCSTRPCRADPHASIDAFLIATITLLPSLRAVYFITTPSLHRHCERLEKPRGNPCNTMYASLKNGSPRFARDDAVVRIFCANHLLILIRSDKAFYFSPSTTAFALRKVVGRPLVVGIEPIASGSTHNTAPASALVWPSPLIQRPAKQVMTKWRLMRPSLSRWITSA